MGRTPERQAELDLIRRKRHSKHDVLAQEYYHAVTSNDIIFDETVKRKREIGAIIVKVAQVSGVGSVICDVTKGAKTTTFGSLIGGRAIRFLDNMVLENGTRVMIRVVSNDVDFLANGVSVVASDRDEVV